MVKTKCVECGREFDVKPYLLKKGYGKFCSRKCYGKWQSKHRRGKNNPCWKPKIVVKCSYCGKEIERHPYLKNQKHHFCSKECFHKWQRETGFLLGEKNPQWKGGHFYYRGSNWNKIRRMILERDNYTCQICGSKKDLVVHHKIPYALFDSFQEANKPENLITLCRECHGKEEIKFWNEHPELIPKRRRKPLDWKMKICEICGEPFIPNSGAQKVCDNCCILTCLNCGRKFYAKMGVKKRPKFCSRRCMYEYRQRNKNRMGENTKTLEEIFCESN